MMRKFSDLKALFEASASPERALSMSAYMRNKFPFYGIPAPQRRLLFKPLLQAEKRAGVIDADFLARCWADEHREFQYLVIEYLVAMRRFLRPEHLTMLEAFARSRQWWDSIDGLHGIFGYLGLNYPEVASLMLKWSEDEDFWIRRIAIDHQIGRKELTDTRLLERILVANFGSREFFINKAIGWSLRNYSRTDADWVRTFIEKHGERMSRLSLREASKYL